MMQAIGIQEYLASDSGCVWWGYWLQSNREGNTAARTRATAVLVQAPAWPEVVATDGGGVVTLYQQIATAANVRRCRADPAGVHRELMRLATPAVGDQVSGASVPRDRAADFDRLYRATRTEILADLVRRSARREDVADVLAEVYLTAWRRIDDIPEGNDAVLWLYGVARHSLANHRRRDDTMRRIADRLRDELRTHGAGRGTGTTTAKSVAIHNGFTPSSPHTGRCSR